MTLIAMMVNTFEGGFFATSDILISVDDLRLRDRDILPLQYGLIINNPSTLGTRVASKAVIFGNYLLQWAGDVEAANHLINVIKEEQPKDETMFWSIAKQISKEHREFSAIINYYDGLISWGAGWNVKPLKIGRYELSIAGTGDDDFIERIDFDANMHPLLMASPIAMAAFRLSLLEVTDRTQYLSRFGGGYEFFSWKEGGGFKRLSYSVCEVSHYDHVNNRFSHIWFPSRLIKCTPIDQGSIFETVLLPSPNAGGKFVSKTFPVFELGADSTEVPPKIPNLELDFGACIVIDHHSFVRVDSSPFVDFETNGERMNIRINDPRIQSVIDEYVAYAGKNPLIKEVGDLAIIPCFVCKKKFADLNHRNVYDEDDIPLGSVKICDGCIDAYDKGIT